MKYYLITIKTYVFIGLLVIKWCVLGVSLCTVHVTLPIMYHFNIRQQYLLIFRFIIEIGKLSHYSFPVGIPNVRYDLKTVFYSIKTWYNCTLRNNPNFKYLFSKLLKCFLFIVSSFNYWISGWMKERGY